LHEADEYLSSLGEAGDKGAEIIQFAADAGAEAVVDEEGDLRSVGRDVGEIEKRSDMVVDLDGEVFCGCDDRCFGVESDDGLGGGRTLLLGEGMDTGEGECEDCKCEDGFLHLASILLSIGLDAERVAAVQLECRKLQKKDRISMEGRCSLY
jgi:hypothetical protein